MRAINRRRLLAQTAAAGATAGALGSIATSHRPAFAQEVGEREVTLTLWSWWNQAFRDLAPLFTEQYPNIQIEFVDVASADIRQRAVTSLVSGTGAPDIVGGQDYDLPIYAATGGLADLTEHLEPYREDIVSYKLNNATFEDRLYGVPWDGAPSALYYRTDIFEQYGVDVEAIDTYDELIDAGRQLVEGSGGDVKLFNLARQSWQPFVNLTWQQGGGIYDVDSGDVIIDDERAVRALNWLKELWDEEVVHQDIGTEAADAALQDGTSAAALGAIWLQGTIEGVAPETSGNWRITSLPKFNESDAGTFALGGSQLMIPAQSEAIPEAFAFLEFTQLSQEGSVINWESGSLFPVLNDAPNWPVMEQEVDFYGGQQALKLFAELNTEVPPYHLGRNFVEATEILNNTVTHVLNDEADPQSALTDAADQIRDLEFF